MKQPSFDIFELFSIDPGMEHLRWCIHNRVRPSAEASRERVDFGVWKTASMVGTYVVCGENAFVLGDRQMRVFGQLDVSKVCWSDLELPYDTFYVAFDRAVLLRGMPDLVDRTLFDAKLSGFLIAKQRVEHRHTDGRVERDPHGRIAIYPVFVDRDMKARGQLGVLLTLDLPERITIEEAFDQYKGPSGVVQSIREHFAKHPPDDEGWAQRILRGFDEISDELVDVYFPICIGAITYLSSTRPTTTHVTRESVLREAKRTRDKRAKRKLVKRATRLSDKARVSVVYPDCPEYEVSPHWRRGHAKHVWVGTRTDADGNPRKGTHRELRFIPPTLVRRDKADGEEPGARTYHFPPMNFPPMRKQ